MYVLWPILYVVWHIYTCIYMQEHTFACTSTDTHVGAHDSMTANTGRGLTASTRRCIGVCASQSEGGFCPYYLMLEAEARSDVVCLPYNYLFDPGGPLAASRQMLSKDALKDAIVIIDEAHNIDRVCHTHRHRHTHTRTETHTDRQVDTETDRQADTATHEQSPTGARQQRKSR